MPPTDPASGPARPVINDWLVAEMEERFRDDPSSVPVDWQEHFRHGANGAVGRGGASGGTARASNGAPSVAGGRGLEPAVAAIDPDGPEPRRLRGTGARIVENMDRSLAVPTATSVREVPAKLLEVNRRIVNNYLKRIDGGKVSFTHLIAYAMVRALDEVPAMVRRYTEVDGKPAVIEGGPIGLGLAVDVPGPDGSRSLLVPVIADAVAKDFAGFLSAYEAVIRRIRANDLDPAMFAGATLTITNPGTIGTVHSVPRLMPGQAVILGVGSIDLPAAFQAADPRTIADLGISKVVTLTSTYDHRVIQGAESGAYLKRVHELLIGEHDFYDEIFRALGLPYEPARWRSDDAAQDSTDAQLAKQLKVSQLVNAYRVRGHLIADLDPLRQKPPSMHPELDPNTYGLSIWDLDREFLVEIAGGAPMRMQLGTILAVLRDAYCRTIGVEFGHVLDPEEKRWLRGRLEGVSSQTSADDQQWILERLNAAEAFESFLHTKYVGQKRFGLEGAESLIPLLDAICERAADDGLEDVVMGMAHRGRLNVLSNVLGKSHRQIFGEFEGELSPDTVQGSGDVKYHLGTHSTFTARSGATVDLHLPPNPSHLEAVDPVVEGIVRAMQDRYDRGDAGEFPALPLLIHGDAAFAGQGVVFETLHLSQLRGYRTGGTVHVVVNNQVGFTTSPDSSRSSHYATDVAKAVQAPIVHVNSDDPEAVVRVARLAFDYRQRFNRDIVIDLVCYRRHGHNEADDPSFTQPGMYRLIDERPSVRRLYTQRLAKRGDLTPEQAEDVLRDFQARLESAFEEAKEAKQPEPPLARPPVERGVLPPADTAVSREMLDRVAEVNFSVPEGFRRHPKLDRILQRAHERYREGEIDWALGEALAIGTLLAEGTWVRLAGQDSRRGTFSHRHAVQVDYETGEDHVALAHLGDMVEQPAGDGGVGRGQHAPFDRRTGERRLRLLRLLGLVERGLEARLEVAQHVLGLLGREVPTLREPLGVEAADRGTLVDEAVHLGLRERRVVGLVVAVTPVADEIDDDVAVELLAVVEREARDPHDGFRVIAVDVDDRRLHGLGHIGRVVRRAGRVRRGREADLVVDDHMHGAAGPVAAQLRQVERLEHHALPGEGRVAVDEQRQHRELAVVATVVAVLHRPNDALDDRVDGLEVRRVRREVQVDGRS